MEGVFDILDVLADSEHGAWWTEPAPGSGLAKIFAWEYRVISFLRRLLDSVLGVEIPWFYKWSGIVLALILIFFLVREFGRTWLLLRHLQRPWPFLTTLGLVVLGAEHRSLYKAARLRIEWELLNPAEARPNRINFATPQEYRDETIDWSKKRRKWKQDRNGRLRRLVRSAESTEPIAITNCTPLLIDEDSIERYFNALATQRRLRDLVVDRGRRYSGWLADHGFPGGQQLYGYFDNRGSDLLSGEEPRFLSRVMIGSGFVAPLHLLTGLLVRYGESWEKLSDEYGKSVTRFKDPFRYKDIRKIQASILNLWLVWGPSIPLCRCPEWHGDVLLQYGVVDEDNSISLRCSSPRILETLRDPDPDLPPGLAVAARIIGTLRWGPAVRETTDICPAQQAIWHNDRLVFDATEGSVQRAGGTIDQVYATLYSAYLWIAFAMCHAETGEPYHPGEGDQWRDLIPFFEHANIADGDTYDFHTSQLACAAVEGALRLLRLDEGLQLRFVCAVDESGCGYSLRFPAGPTTTIREKMQRFASTCAGPDPAMERLLLHFDPKRPWRDGDYSACALPDILSAYYRASDGEHAMPEIRELQIADRKDKELLRRFYDECYVAEFPDPNERETLKNIQDSLRQKETAKYGANNYHVLIAVDDDGAPVGGSICDYFHKPNAGVIEYILVEPGLRKSGLGGHLLHETERILRQDARDKHNSKRLDWMVAEVDDPYLTRVKAHAFDPFNRARIWDRWGYRILDFPYVQPALSKKQKPLDHLKLMVKPCSDRFTDSVPADDVRRLLLDYIRQAMRKKNPEKDRGFKKMSAFLSAETPPIGLLPVGDYIGWDKRGHLLVDEILTQDEPELADAVKLYPRIFPDTSRAISADDLRKYAGPNGFKRKPGCHYRLWTMRRKRDYHYHLWTMRIAQGMGCEGMASFVATPVAGFGQLGFTEQPRETDDLPYIVRRIEERMVRDHTQAQGWYIECDDEPARAAFTNPDIGFHELDVTYLQPRRKGDDRERPVHLLYKPFGRVYGKPTIPVRALLRAVKELHKSMYQEQDCDNAFRALRKSVRKQHTVPIKT